MKNIQNIDILILDAVLNRAGIYTQEITWARNSVSGPSF